MKLNDIKPTLQEALNLDWCFNLMEVLNIKFSSIVWKREDRSEVGTAELAGETYKVLLEPGEMKIDDVKYTYINAAFQKIVDGQPTEKIQLTQDNASKIVGAVRNAILDRIKLYNFDAIIFIAADNVESRMAIYNKIADREWVNAGLGITLKNIKLKNGALCTALLSKELGEDKQNKVIAYIKNLESGK